MNSASSRQRTGNVSLGDAQREFTLDIAKLIMHMYERGYEATCGDFFRDHRVHGPMGVKKSYSAANSRHKQKLAADLNLFLNGKYLRETDDHKEFGAYWESLHPDNRWGGRWDDGNHYQRNYDVN